MHRDEDDDKHSYYGNQNRLKRENKLCMKLSSKFDIEQDRDQYSCREPDQKGFASIHEAFEPYHAVELSVGHADRP